MLNTVYKEATSLADFKAGTSLDGNFNFLLSSPFEQDGHGDLVGDPDDPQYGWDLSVHNKNPASFWAHNTQLPPIARWENVSVRNGALRGTLVFPPRGVSPLADEIRALCEAGIVRGVSVGFRPTKSKPRANGGVHYLRQTLLEASLCGIPSLPSALMEARALGVSEGTIQKVFRMPTKKPTETIGERIRRARRVVAKAKSILAKTSNPKSRATLLKTIAILSAEDNARMAASIKPPPESREAKIARVKSVRARAEAVLRKSYAGEEAESPAGQQRRQYTETIERFTELSKRHPADPPKPKPTEQTTTWQGQKIDQRPTWQGKKV